MGTASVADHAVHLKSALGSRAAKIGSLAVCRINTKGSWMHSRDLGAIAITDQDLTTNTQAITATKHMGASRPQEPPTATVHL